MTFLATASGLMIESVRSTAIPGLRLDKCEEIQDYIMSGAAACGARPPKMPPTARRQKQRRAKARLAWKCLILVRSCAVSPGGAMPARPGPAPCPRERQEPTAK